MRGTYVTATIIAVLIGLWLFSGQIGGDPPPEHPTLAEANVIRSSRTQDAVPVRVRGRVIQAEPQINSVVLRGRLENKRTVEVKAELSGRVTERPVERGTKVESGDLLCRLGLDDRQASVEEAEQIEAQARIDYEGSLKLKERGFQSDTAIAQARARLAAAEAQVVRSRLDLERTQIRAPFAAIVENVHLEIGDYVTPGAACATLVDMDPMLMIGRVAERDVGKLGLHQIAIGHLNDGRMIEGQLTFIGQQTDPTTRTFAVEVQVPNPDLALRSGITSEIRIPVSEALAQKVSPSLFALNDAGDIGVRIVNGENRVEFHLVDIVNEEPDGVWVTGLPALTTLITVGQELVVEGQRVEVAYEPAAPAVPVIAPARPSPRKDSAVDADPPLSSTDAAQVSEVPDSPHRTGGGAGIGVTAKP